MRLTLCVLIELTSCVLCISANPACLRGESVFELDRREDAVTVRLNGALFTRYIARGGACPNLWPIIGPGGVEMTRAYPMREKAEGETHDHPHHRSMWYSHGAVNGVDFWSQSRRSGMIRHREFLRVESAPVPLIETKNDWVNDSGEPICSDTRVISFAAEDDRQWIDFDITLFNDTQQPVVFGDTKEGTFALRVAESMTVDAGLGGEIVNSLGTKNDAAWGQQASWVDYHGPIGDNVVGIAVLNHPNSFRFPTFWHVRTYGLLAANVFGIHNFKNSHEEDGSFTLRPGESISFYYRVILHRGDEQEGRIPESFADYVKVDKPVSGVAASSADPVPLVEPEQSSRVPQSVP